MSNFTNSPLVVYTKLSPNCNKPRNAKIDTITIHCVVGQVTAERLGDIFAPESRGASSNYGVDKDGRVGMYVEEKNRSWCTSSSSNDNRAITIEVASDNFHPYAVTDKALASLINLCADICKRNSIKQLLWKNDKNLIGKVDKQNMTVHMWFANKACPGQYLLDRHSYIASEVNKILGSNITTPPITTTPSNIVTTTTGRALYKNAYVKEFICNIPVGSKVEWISDDGWGWSKVKFNGHTGWVKHSGLSNKAKLSPWKKCRTVQNAKGYGQVTKNNVTTPDKKVLATIPANTTLIFICVIDGFVQTNYKNVDMWIAKSDLKYPV